MSLRNPELRGTQSGGRKVPPKGAPNTWRGISGSLPVEVYRQTNGPLLRETQQYVQSRGLLIIRKSLLFVWPDLEKRNSTDILLSAGWSWPAIAKELGYGCGFKSFVAPL